MSSPSISIKLAHLVVHDLRINLVRISKLHLREIDTQISFEHPIPEKIKNQMQLLAIVIQNLTNFYGDTL